MAEINFNKKSTASNKVRVGKYTYVKHLVFFFLFFFQWNCFSKGKLLRQLPSLINPWTLFQLSSYKIPRKYFETICKRFKTVRRKYKVKKGSFLMTSTCHPDRRKTEIRFLWKTHGWLKWKCKTCLTYSELRGFTIINSNCKPLIACKWDPR